MLTFPGHLSPASVPHCRAVGSIWIVGQRLQAANCHAAKKKIQPSYSSQKKNTKEKV